MNRRLPVHHILTAAFALSVSASQLAAGEVESSESHSNVKVPVLTMPTAQKLQVGFDTDVRYSDNLLLGPSGSEVEAYTYTFSPELLYRILGDEFTEQMVALAYSPTFYFDDFDEDVLVNHDADVVYRFDTGRTRIDLIGTYSHVEGSNARDLGQIGDSILLREQRQAESDRYGANLNLSYAVSTLIDAEVRGGYNRARFGSLNDYTTYGGDIALLYGGRDAITRIGPYVGYERVESEGSPSQDAYQVGGRVDWDYSALTNFFAQVGYDSRDFEGGRSTSEDIVWSGGMRWQPDPLLHTELAISRVVSPSISSDNQNHTTTAISLAVRKDLLEHYFVRAVGSYAWSEYEGTRAGVTTNREDDYVSVYTEIGRKLSDYGELSLFYNFLDNDSSVGLLSFESNTVGVKFSVDF